MCRAPQPTELPHLVSAGVLVLALWAGASHKSAGQQRSTAPKQEEERRHMLRQTTQQIKVGWLHLNGPTQPNTDPLTHTPKAAS